MCAGDEDRCACAILGNLVGADTGVGGLAGTCCTGDGGHALIDAQTGCFPLLVLELWVVRWMGVGGGPLDTGGVGT